MAKLMIVNGPNLNLLGEREPEVYGSETLAELEASLEQRFGAEHSLSFFQSNHEGALIDCLQQHRHVVDGYLVNFAAYTHSSIALRDCVAAISKPVVEVHLSNIHARESFRSKSLIAPVAQGLIVGFGSRGYVYGVMALLDLIEA